MSLFRIAYGSAHEASDTLQDLLALGVAKADGCSPETDGCRLAAGARSPPPLLGERHAVASDITFLERTISRVVTESSSE